MQRQDTREEVLKQRVPTREHISMRRAGSCGVACGAPSCGKLLRASTTRPRDAAQQRKLCSTWSYEHRQDLACISNDLTRTTHRHDMKVHAIPWSRAIHVTQAPPSYFFSPRPRPWKFLTPSLAAQTWELSIWTLRSQSALNSRMNVPQCVIP